ncbi:MAG TPA: hypothetical protein VE449_00485 [Thermoleophilaceae bacterium]|jgi:hypothetical protein|nr:hypothetical protein [Thermoleophilaceae bacterium]
MAIIPDEQLGELLGLLRDVDSVELKLTVPESDHFAAAAALGLDPLDAQIRQVYFFDTPDLDLNRAGVVVRARRMQGKSGDAIVKLRPVVPDEVPSKLRRADGFNIELDAMPGRYVCSGRLKERVTNGAVREVALGDRPLRELLSKQQRELLAGHAPDGVDIDGLAVLGPILALKLKFGPEGFARRLVVELWMYPDSSRVLELSTKCDPGEAFLAAAEARAFLSERGVDLGGDQEAKTIKALEFFARA